MTSMLDLDTLNRDPELSLQSAPWTTAAPALDQELIEAGDPTSEFELNFLSEFLLHDELVPPPVSPEPLSMSGSGEDEEDDRSTHSSDGDSPKAGSLKSAASSHTDSFSSQLAVANKPLDRKAKRRQQVAISARRHRCRKKHELMDLRSESEHLQSQLEYLRSKHKLMRPHGAMAEWQEVAMASRRKRKQAEDENAMLRRAIFMQSGFMAQLKSAFISTPPALMEINMRRYLHTYTQLSAAPAARRRDIDSICTESKFDLAMAVLLRETDGIDFTTPYIGARPVHTEAPDQFGGTTVGVYAFDTLDMNKIFLSACAAIRDSGIEWPQYQPIEAEAKVTDAPSYNVRYGVATIKYQNERDPEEIVLVETRGISFYRVTESYGILVWDFVDHDSLYPLHEDAKLKRDVVGAVLVRRERCDDGVERVVVRSVCTKIHHIQTPVFTNDTRRFAHSSESGATVCGESVFNHIKSSFQEHLQQVVSNV